MRGRWVQPGWVPVSSMAGSGEAGLPSRFRWCGRPLPSPHEGQAHGGGGQGARASGDDHLLAVLEQPAAQRDPCGPGPYGPLVVEDDGDGLGCSDRQAGAERCGERAGVQAAGSVSKVACPAEVQWNPAPSSSPVVADRCDGAITTLRCWRPWVPSRSRPGRKSPSSGGGLRWCTSARTTISVGDVQSTRPRKPRVPARICLRSDSRQIATENRGESALPMANDGEIRSRHARPCRGPQMVFYAFFAAVGQVADTGWMPLRHRHGDTGGVDRGGPRCGGDP